MTRRGRTLGAGGWIAPAGAWKSDAMTDGERMMYTARPEERYRIARRCTPKLLWSSRFWRSTRMSRPLVIRRGSARRAGRQKLGAPSDSSRDQRTLFDAFRHFGEVIAGRWLTSPSTCRKPPWQ